MDVEEYEYKKSYFSEMWKWG